MRQGTGESWEKRKEVRESVDDAVRNVPILHPAPRVHSIARTRLDQSLSQHCTLIRDRCIGSRFGLVKTHVIIILTWQHTLEIPTTW